MKKNPAALFDTGQAVVSSLDDSKKKRKNESNRIEG